MNSITAKRFQKILEKLKPAERLENVGADLPESGTNQDLSNDSVDALRDQSNLQESLTEGHITGTGGPVCKNAAVEELSEAAQAEANRLNTWADNYYPELGLLNYPAVMAPLSGAMDANRMVLSNPFTAALGYGGLGAAAAAGTIGVKNWLRGRKLTEADKQRQRKQKLLAGLAGAGVGLGIRKWGSFGAPMGDPLTFIAMKLKDDTTMSPIQQQQMLDAISQLSHTKQFGLAQLLTTVAGAGIGAVVAKFLMNMGVAGTVGGALLGGFFGSRAGRFPENQAGTINNSVDFFGRPI